jgi:hypothetical protein
MSAIIPTHYFGTKNANGTHPYELDCAVFPMSIMCMMTNKEKQTKLCSIYDCNTLPTDKLGNTITLQNARRIMLAIGGNETRLTFISESQVDVRYVFSGVIIEFAIKLQPFVMRTDDVVFAEVEEYLETMDNVITGTFHWKYMRLDLFGHYLTEHWKNYGFDKVMQEIRETIAEMCSVKTFDELMNHVKFNVLHARIVAIETFYKNFEKNVIEQRMEFEKDLCANVKCAIAYKELLCNDDMRKFIGDVICNFVDDDLPKNAPIPVFAKGVIVNFKKMEVFTDADEGMVGIFEPCIDALMQTEFAKLFPIYTIDAGKYAKMVFNVEGIVKCYTIEERDTMLGKFAEINPMLSADVMKSAFGKRSNPSLVGKRSNPSLVEYNMLVVECSACENNDVQQHLISILDEEIVRMEIIAYGNMSGLAGSN